jgi:hypothetical protein
MSPTSNQQLTDIWGSSLHGHFISGWWQLCSAAQSSLRIAGEQTGQVLSEFRQNQAKSLEGGELVGSFTFDYEVRLTGPLFSSVILSAFSLEAFLRLALLIGLRAKHQDREHVESRLRHIEERASRNQRGPFNYRVDELLRILGDVSIPNRFRDAADKLMSYRNQCAHDEPRWFEAEIGVATQFKRGRRLGDPLRKYRFPLPGDDLWPLSLKDALWAASTHDRFVHALPSELLDVVFDKSIVGGLWAHERRIISAGVEKLHDLASLWHEEVEPFRRSVNPGDFRDFEATMRRRQFKVVDETFS